LKQNEQEIYHLEHPLLLFWTYFMEWRYFWTSPGRKQPMWSSSFPTTITIPNFKSMSLDVLEFWKRYQQKNQFPRAESWPRSCLY
jgi:hypothetical protein